MLNISLYMYLILLGGSRSGAGPGVAAGAGAAAGASAVGTLIPRDSIILTALSFNDVATLTASVKLPLVKLV